MITVKSSSIEPELEKYKVDDAVTVDKKHSSRHLQELVLHYYAISYGTPNVLCPVSNMLMYMGTKVQAQCHS